MTSSMLTGERRWASARRSGMTVLGKVAVPKPINLPSQRLENHGLDPNVEIVPKGTHSWGSRSSSSTSNAWGSSSLSPNTDSGTGSPSHLSGRPSSGGSGTRPSTAGSDRAHEPITNAWGSNSRPSSSSGALTSNQTSHITLRPRSAETRPGSSQLSRFAEPLSDNLVAWGAPGTTEKLGVTSSKNDGFSLTSGDFPTLGSEKDNSAKNADSQDHGSHGRPGSSSAGVASGKERIGDSSGDSSVHANVKSEAASPWRRENSLYGEDGARSNVEKWHADPHPYPNSSIPPQHYDSWHGPPVNNHPGGVWYGRPPGGPPFGPPVAPGGFPMEPFPYYGPQIPSPALANPQPGPPPGAGPRGPHPKNGDMYRPHMHDAYIRPSMPIRPGFYPGPVPYENYYAPPMGYCNSSERDVPFMGMAVGPAAYSRYPGPNVPDPGNSHGRTSGYGPSSKAMVSEQVEAGHPQDTRGPYKVLLKQHDGWDGKDEGQKWDDTMKTNASYPLKGEHPRKSLWENGLRDDRKDDDFDARRMALGEESSSEAIDNRGVAAINVKSPGSGANLNVSDDRSVKKFEHASSNFPEVLAAPKDSSLIQKIEGLNAKARASDGRQDVKSVFSREEQNNKLQVGNATDSHSTNEADIDSLSHEKTYVSGIVNSVPHEDHFSAGGKSIGSTVVSGMANTRRSSHGMHGRVDHRGKGRFNTQEGDGWRRKSEVADPQSVVSGVHYEFSSVHMEDYTPAETTQNSVSHSSGKDDGESVPNVSDPNDIEAQIKRSDAAKRIKQEEEERTREQKAKAFAKLEELNRRTQTAGDGLTQKLNTVPTIAIQNRQEESLNLAQQTVIKSRSGAPSSLLGSNPNTVAQSREKLETVPSSTIQNRHEESTAAGPLNVVASKSRASSSALGSSPSMVVQSSESSVKRVEKFSSMASNVPLEKPKSVCNENVVVHEQSKIHDVNNADSANRSGTSRVHDSSGSKLKRMGYRQKQSSPLEKNSNDKLIASSTTEASKGPIDMVGNATISPESVADEIASNCESNLPANPGVTAESSVHHRRKNRSGKNKHKVEEVSSAEALPSVLSKDTTTLDTSIETVKPKNSESLSDRSSIRSPTDSNDANQSSELRLSLPNEETHIRVNNQWKAQHPRRMMRNPQGNKSAEKNQSGDAVVWAPVRAQNKTEVSDEANQNTSIEAVVLSTKSDQQVQNNPRNKRAEMERYIPKPVAKELSQQVNSHQAVVPPSNQITSDGTAERPESGSVGAGSSQTSGAANVKASPAMESRSGDVRQNKSGKVHGSWRQRAVAESGTLYMSRNFQKSTEDHQHQKPDLSSLKEQARHSGEWNASDGRNMLENPDTAITVSVLKDQGVTVRGKRQPHKSHKGTGYNHNSDEKKISSGDAEKVQSAAPEMHQTDLPASSKEIHTVGERSTSHWQPKSQPISATNQRGSQPNSGLNIGAEGSMADKREFTPQSGEPLLPQPVKDATAARPQSHHDQCLSQKSSLEEAPSDGHQELKREKKMAAERGRPGSPAESSPSNMDVRHDQRSSGFRKNGNQNSRFSREHESRGDWSGSGKDNKQHNAPVIRERQRHNSHFEYQPVGPHNNNKAINFEPSKDGSHNSGGRNRERGQNHSRRGGGNFYGRQAGSVQVDAAGFE